MKNISFVNLKKPAKFFRSDIHKIIDKILTEAEYILGKENNFFEKEFARYCDIKYAVGVASGTDAIILALHAIGIKQGDEVITVANTYISTVLAIIRVGAKPVLVDCDPITYQIDTKAIESVITKKTRVIIPVHLYGYPADMNEIKRIGYKHHLFIIEDACQAHGTIYNNKKAGTFGDIGCFSFYPSKNLGAIGDGGCIVTNNRHVSNMIKIMSNIGQKNKNQHVILGYNSRLDTVQAAILRLKLPYLDRYNFRRRQIAQIYNKLLSNLPIVIPPKETKQIQSNYHLYVILTQQRNQLATYLKQKGITCGIHYPSPVHEQQCMKFLGYKHGDFPISEKLSKKILSLPIYPELTKSEILYIAKMIRKFYSK
jgi:dTDP-4-amino-4,6-dideoxygalactose transaminase